MKAMDLNKETAMRLWNKSFGNEIKVVDFAGREIVKGAYNDRNSEFGWNVDHIYPQSLGGKTADYNLVCCNIKTNDEKADKFPCFNANGKKFQIIKVENHYEIQPIIKVENSLDSKPVEKPVNFYDFADGIRCYKKLKGIQNKGRFVGKVIIRLRDVSNNALVDFIDKLFNAKNISYEKREDEDNSDETEMRFIITCYNLEHKEDTQSLFDTCVLLNTYLNYYFYPLECISAYDIYFLMEHFDAKDEMYYESNDSEDYIDNFFSPLSNTIFINWLVWNNTSAKDKINEPNGDSFEEYSFIYVELGKNLKKEVERHNLKR